MFRVLLGTARNELQGLERSSPINNVQTMPQLIGQSLWAARTAAGLLALLGALAITLASIGIYGVMAYIITQRQREIGTRMALGGSQNALLGLFLKRGMLLVVAGAAAGLLAAALLGASIRELLFDVSPADPVVYAITTLTLILVAFLANIVPALRATAVDPVRVLKQE